MMHNKHLKIMFYGATAREEFHLETEIRDNTPKIIIRNTSMRKKCRPCSSLWQAMRKTRHRKSGPLEGYFEIFYTKNTIFKTKIAGNWILAENGILTFLTEHHFITLPRKIAKKSLNHISNILLPDKIDLLEDVSNETPVKNGIDNPTIQPFCSKKKLSIPGFTLVHSMQRYSEDTTGLPKDIYFHLFNNENQKTTSRPMEALIDDPKIMTKNMIHSYRNPSKIELHFNRAYKPTEHEVLIKTREIQKNIEDLMPEIEEWMPVMIKERQEWGKKPDIEDVLYQNALKYNISASKKTDLKTTPSDSTPRRKQ